MTLLIILIIYAALMMLFGAIVSRRVRASSDFFVAGRGLGAGLIFSTLLAANIGAGSTVGAAGLGYRNGLSAWWWVGSAGIGSLILAFAVGPKIWQVAKEHDLYTVGDYLEFRYDKRVRGLTALLLWFGSLSILAGQLIAVAWILNVVAGVSKPVGCAIAAIVITTYFSLGGLHATARVNVLQLTVKMAGFLLALVYLLNTGDGLTKEQLARSGVEPIDKYFGLLGQNWPVALGYLAILAPSFVISPGLLQKVFGARDKKAVRVGVGLNAVSLLAYAIVPVLIGVIARARFPGLTNHELALPTLLTQALPLWLGALLLGAIFSAELSAADAALFMLSTSLGKDLYKSFVNPEATDERLMRVAKAAAIVCGMAGAILASFLPTVITALSIFYTLLAAALTLPLIAGLYTRKVTAHSATVSMIISVVITFAIDLISKGRGVSGVPSLIIGIVSGALTMWITSAAGKSVTQEPQQSLTTTE
ncbi:MAG TPA: sodium:solute symporter family protein [Blastocatellia bacterium]|nr:sodium:solute symporter family protein [Blastocatellia bacterium]